MLDTNVVSDLIRNPVGPAAERVRAHEGAVCTSVIVAAEMRYGCVKKGSQGLARKVERLLGEIGVLAFEAPADEAYGRLRWGLESAGRVIGPNDLLIAAHALSLGLVLVTGNLGEFSRVPGLRLENWVGGRIE